MHDWVSHARHKPGENDVVVPLPAGEPPWVSWPGGPAEAEMRISGNLELKSDPNQAPILFANSASHWWDGSEVYGPDEKNANLLREDINGVKGAKLHSLAATYRSTSMASRSPASTKAGGSA